MWFPDNKPVWFVTPGTGTIALLTGGGCRRMKNVVFTYGEYMPDWLAGLCGGWLGCVFLVVTIVFPSSRGVCCQGWCGWKGYGGHSVGETPGPIPNPEAKTHSADGTASGRMWESRSPPDNISVERLRSAPYGAGLSCLSTRLGGAPSWLAGPYVFKRSPVLRRDGSNCASRAWYVHLLPSRGRIYPESAPEASFRLLGLRDAYCSICTRQ